MYAPTHARTHARPLMKHLLEEQDKMLRSFQAQLGENAEAGAEHDEAIAVLCGQQG